MRRHALAVALALSTWAVVPASSARADDGPDPAHLRTAAEHFDAGVKAYKSKDYEGAAAHFEAADVAVPSPNALRQAIRARAEAGQGAQAATLAEQALARYGGDDATLKLAHETLEKLEPLLQKVRVKCTSPCTITVGTRPVPGEPAAAWVVYARPRLDVAPRHLPPGTGGAERRARSRRPGRGRGPGDPGAEEEEGAPASPGPRDPGGRAQQGRAPAGRAQARGAQGGALQGHLAGVLRRGHGGRPWASARR